MKERSAAHVQLVEAFAQPGCPVCRCLVAESRRYLHALLYEGVTDPQTRRAIRASWGFCNWHTWMLLEVDDARFGAAILYEDLVRQARRRTERLGRRAGQRRGARWAHALLPRRGRRTLAEAYRRRRPCPACAHARDTELRYLRTLVRAIDDAEVQAAYAGSDGACLPHVVRAIQAEPRTAAVEGFVARTRESWAGIGRDIAAFVAKHDHRNRQPYTAAEASSYTRAFEMLAGARGLPGRGRDL